MNAKTISAFVEMSRKVGQDNRLVQGGGGNTSAKSEDGRYMAVKASGTPLGDMTSENGLRVMDVERLNQILANPELPQMPPTPREKEILRLMIDACVDERPGRPSVEAALHALLDRFVVHTHPALLNGYLCSKEGVQTLQGLLDGKKISHVYVPYTDPGYTLARKVEKTLDEHAAEHGRLPSVILLQNHGVFVSADSSEGALKLTDQVCKLAEAHYRKVAGQLSTDVDRPEDADVRILQVAAAIRRHLVERGSQPPLLRLVCNDTIEALLAKENARKLIGARPLFPDQVVYLGEKLVWLRLPAKPETTIDSINSQLARLKTDRTNAFVVDGLGAFVAATNVKSLETNEAVLTAAVEVLNVADELGGPKPLTARQVGFLAEWEAELYRQKLVTGEGGPALMHGKVAVVTGAGSGIGRGVSIGLAKSGAFVVLADIDVPAAQETADLIRQETGEPRGLPAEVDVTDEESVIALFSRIVRERGGVDVLVNAAGIAPVSPLVDFPLKAWRKTLEINLTGYFLIAREAARVMVRQGTGGSIVNISSKTGLFPSKNHSAYNATKSGEIHLARGWALELAQHKIRVNAICPGNVFQGSKIWNPEYIKALGKKRGLAPEEVIPYYVNMTALKEEITWDDITNGVIFLSSDMAAKVTGQTLVIDAGQVFVR